VGLLMDSARGSGRCRTGPFLALWFVGSPDGVLDGSRTDE
jgi:hypothetical protein